MTDGELATITTAIVGGLGGIGAVLRWSVTRITKAIEANSAIMLEFVKSATRLEVKLDHAHAASVATAAVMHEVADEISGTHDAPEDPPHRNTPVGGYAIHKRKGTRQ